MSLRIELESEDSRTQVTLIGFYLFGRLATVAPWRGGTIDIHHRPHGRKTGNWVAMIVGSLTFNEALRAE